MLISKKLVHYFKIHVDQDHKNESFLISDSGATL